MSGGAYVGSFEAVRDFRAALVVFLHEVREALTSHDLEVRRTLEWVFESEPQRWRQATRACEDELTQAKIELERCRHTKLPGGEPPSCIDERKAVERARQRRLYAEQKLEAVRRWGQQLGREAAEYSARATQLGDLVEVDMAGAVAMLDRVLTSLEAYTAVHPAATATRSQSAAPTSVARPIEKPQQDSPLVSDEAEDQSPRDEEHA
jgi:hypothetical protein